MPTRDRTTYFICAKAHVISVIVFDAGVLLPDVYVKN